MSDTIEARRLLIARVLEGDGQASKSQRRAAFDNAPPPEPFRTLIAKVATRAYEVTDEDVDSARAAGLSEDQIFELVVCGALGQAARQHDQAIAALKVALKQE
jgi:hypothetical protein